jgi:hypothetical protein
VKLVAEAEDSVGTQKKGNIHSWKLLPRMDTEDRLKWRSVFYSNL